MPYPIPPWMAAPADPAAHFTTGVQLGMRMGAEQQAAQIADAQLQREIQRDEIDRQMKQTIANLKVQDVARRYKASRQYQDMISSGVSPRDALLKLGPEMGVPMSGLATLAKPPQPHYGTVSGVGMVQVDPATGQSTVVQAEIPKTIQAASEEPAEIGGRKYMRITQPSGHVQLMDLESATEQQEQRQISRAQFALRRIDREISALEKDADYDRWSIDPAKWPKTLNALQREVWQKKYSKLKALEAERDAAERGTSSAAAPAPARASGTTSKVGRFTIIEDNAALPNQ